MIARAQKVTHKYWALMLISPNRTDTSANGDGMDETLSCQAILSASLIISPTASVATTTVNSGARISGRTSSRSKTMPTTPRYEYGQDENGPIWERSGKREKERRIRAKGHEFALREIEHAGSLEREHQTEPNESINASRGKSACQKLHIDS